MADIKDLISQAQRSKLGRAISNITSNLDRDKQRAGFQFIKPETRQNFQNFQKKFPIQHNNSIHLKKLLDM